MIASRTRRSTPSTMCDASDGLSESLDAQAVVFFHVRSRLFRRCHCFTAPKAGVLECVAVNRGHSILSETDCYLVRVRDDHVLLSRCIEMSGIPLRTGQKNRRNFRQPGSSSDMHKSLINLQLQCLFFDLQLARQSIGDLRWSAACGNGTVRCTQHGQAEIILAATDSRPAVGITVYDPLRLLRKTATPEYCVNRCWQYLLMISMCSSSIPDAEVASSVRSRAMTLLLRSYCADARHAWLDGNNTLAEQELESAIRESDRFAVTQVTANIQYTEARHASERRATHKHVAQRRYASSCKPDSTIGRTLRGHTVEAQLEQQLRALKKHVAELGRNRDTNDST